MIIIIPVIILQEDVRHRIRNKVRVALWDCGLRLSPLGTVATTGLLYQHQMIDDGAIGGMKIGWGNRSTRRKPAPALLCSSQITHDKTRPRTKAASLGSRRLTAWAMYGPSQAGTQQLTLKCENYSGICCKSMDLKFLQRLLWRLLSSGIERRVVRWKRYIRPPSTGSKNKLSKKPARKQVESRKQLYADDDCSGSILREI
jgi:hypothetical protein